MNEIVEQVARAIAGTLSEYGLPVSSPDEGSLDDVERERWEACVAAARATLEALREPTGAMLEVGGGKIAYGRDDRLDEAWRAMIDAALHSSRTPG